MTGHESEGERLARLIREGQDARAMAKRLREVVQAAAKVTTVYYDTKGQGTIAGPVYQLKRALDALPLGDLDTVNEEA